MQNNCVQLNVVSVIQITEKVDRFSYTLIQIVLLLERKKGL